MTEMVHEKEHTIGQNKTDSFYSATVRLGTNTMDHIGKALPHCISQTSINTNLGLLKVDLDKVVHI